MPMTEGFMMTFSNTCKSKSNMSDHPIIRAEILLGQKRYEEASKVLSGLLAQNPNDPHVLMMLSEVSLQQDQAREAEEVIEHAIRLAPDDDGLYYQKARIMLLQEKYDAAEVSLQEAITFNPQQPDYFALLSSIKIARKDFEAGLELANQALALDSENLHALNNRSKALLKLNRVDESTKTIEGALNKDPNNPQTHTTIGWNELERGDHKKAMNHFTEALKQNPNYSYAQAGMMEALKARYWVYRIFLKYVFWSGNLTKKYQWVFIIALYFGTRVLSRLAETIPVLAPYVNPIVLGLVIFALSTWITTPLSNLFLRFNFYGRHLLSRKQKMSSNLVAACLGVLLAGLTGWLLTDQEVYLGMMIYGFTMMIPCSAIFASSKHQLVLPVYTLTIGLLGIVALGYTATTGDLASPFATFFLIGILAFQVLANFLTIRESNL